MRTSGPLVRLFSVTAVAIMIRSGSNVSFVREGTTRGGLGGIRAFERAGWGVEGTGTAARTRAPAIGDNDTARRFAKGEGVANVAMTLRTRGDAGGVENGSMRR